MADHDSLRHPDNELRQDEAQHVDDEEHEQTDGQLHQHEEGELERPLHHPPHGAGGGVHRGVHNWQLAETLFWE